MYTIKEVSELLGLTKHTVRYWTDKGLIPTVQRDENNNRLFDQESVNWLTGIKHLKKGGMSVEDIKRYVDLALEGDSTLPERYEIIIRQKDIALEQLKEAEQRAAYMEEKAKHYLDIMNGAIPDDMNPKEWEIESSNTPNHEAKEML